MKKIVYAEHSDVRAKLERKRAEMSKELGREVSEQELIRTLSVDAAKKTLKAKYPVRVVPPGGLVESPRRRKVA